MRIRRLIAWLLRIDIYRTTVITVVALVLGLMLVRSTLTPQDQTSRVRAFTRQIEFDFVLWTVDAVIVKFGQSALGAQNYLSDEQSAQVVRDYIDLIRAVQDSERELDVIYSDPAVTDPHVASQDLREQLDALYIRRGQIGPLAEAILQTQIMGILEDMGISTAGQPIPPVLYHSTPLPRALIVSPRDIIQRDEHISIVPGLTLEEQIRLEDDVAEALDVSTLIVGIGGIGTYPTMVAQTSNLNWLAEVVAHEWIHNYFNLRPLGLLYTDSPEMRIINETSASIAGKILGQALIARYYPERVPPPPPPPTPEPETATTSEPPAEPVFDFNEEMRITRVAADELLAAGKIEEAEAYMEVRRQFMWEHGYRIRKLNQAYFAFHGAYADSPGGAAGEDPVGAAVRDLWAQSESLAEFLVLVGQISSFEGLLDLIEELTSSSPKKFRHVNHVSFRQLHDWIQSP